MVSFGGHRQDGQRVPGVDQQTPGREAPLSFTVPGVSTVADLVLQSLFVENRVPEHNVAFTNALLAQFGQ